MQYYTRGNTNIFDCRVYKNKRLNIKFNIRITTMIILQRHYAKIVVTTNKYYAHPNSPTIHMPLQVSGVLLNGNSNGAYNSRFLYKLESDSAKRIERIIGKLEKIYLINRLNRLKKHWKYRAISGFKRPQYSLYHANTTGYSPAQIGFKKIRL